MKDGVVDTVSGVATMAETSLEMGALGYVFRRDEFNRRWGTVGSMGEALADDPLGATGSAASALWERMTEPVVERWTSGNRAGAAGYVVPAIVETVLGSKGALRAARAGSMADEAEELAEEAGEAAARSADELADAAGDAARAGDDGRVVTGPARVPTYETPYRPLTPRQRAELQRKVQDRTATPEEYRRLEWDRRFGNRRDRGVNRFWSQERRHLQGGGQGTRNWTPEQRADILAGRRPKYNGETMQGHHRFDALEHPHIADDPTNIYPATKSEHFNRWHGGNWQNDTFGDPLNPWFPEDF